MTRAREIECAGHGKAWETYICGHLFRRPRQAWFGAYPAKDDPWPDAWCAKCNAAYEREGGRWNKRNEDEADIRLICSSCYLDRRVETAAAALKGRDKRRWNDLVAEACVQQDKRQREMVAAHGLDKYPRVRLDLKASELLFRGGRRKPLALRIAAIGTYSAQSCTWLWAWGNWHLPAAVRRHVARLREMGERERFPHLTESIWRAEPHEGWHMAAIAAREMGALGVYQAPGETVTTYLALMKAGVAPRGDES
jgi:hypothetical protein